MRLPKLTYANVVSSLALFLALGGTSWALARNSVGNRELKANAVTSAKIKNRSVALSDLSSSARKGSQGPAGPQGPSGLAPTAEQWRGLPRVGSWIPLGSTNQSPSFRKDQLGIVHLRGFANRSAGPPPVGDPITVLPPGYRPLARETFATSDALGNHVRIDVLPDGQVHHMAGSASPALALSGIAFATD